MKCYGLGQTLEINNGILDVRLAESSGLEILDDGLSLDETQKAPQWTTWTPTLYNLTKGNGTVVARYMNLGGVVQYSFTFTLGSTSSVAASTAPLYTVGFSTPTPIANPGQTGTAAIPMGFFQMDDNGVTNKIGIAVCGNYAESIITLRYYAESAAYTSTGYVSNTTPFTWGTGDTMQARGWYKAPVT